MLTPPQTTNAKSNGALSTEVKQLTSFLPKLSLVVISGVVTAVPVMLVSLVSSVVFVSFTFAAPLGAVVVVDSLEFAVVVVVVEVEVEVEVVVLVVLVVGVVEVVVALVSLVSFVLLSAASQRSCHGA